MKTTQEKNPSDNHEHKAGLHCSVHAMRRLGEFFTDSERNGDEIADTILALNFTEKSRRMTTQHRSGATACLATPTVTVLPTAVRIPCGAGALVGAVTRVKLQNSAEILDFHSATCNHLFRKFP
jgi:hypothetical protein